MIPTAAVSTSNIQTSSSATIGIASLILEGRALSDDEFIISKNGKRHILLFPPGHHPTIEGPNCNRINITTNPTAELSLPLYRATASETSTANATSSDVQHFQRLRQKLTQLRQSSPTSSNSHETYPSMEYRVVVGADNSVSGGGANNSSSTSGSPTQLEDDNLHQPRRRRSFFGGESVDNKEIPSSRPPDNSLLYSLQSLATTCLWSTTPQHNSLTADTDNLPSSDYWYTNLGVATTSHQQHQNNYITQQQLKQQTCGNKQIPAAPKQGPHCDQFLKKIGLIGKVSVENSCTEEHICDIENLNEICYHWQVHCRQIEVMLSRLDPICIEVYLGPENHEILLEQWIIEESDMPTTPTMTIQALCNAIRSQLYFSQISAWTDLIKKTPLNDLCDNLRITTSIQPTTNWSNYVGFIASNIKKPHLDIIYRIKPYDSTASFNAKPIVHNFPNIHISDNCSITVCLKSLPRLPGGIPKLHVNSGCSISSTIAAEAQAATTAARKLSLTSATVVNCTTTSCLAPSSSNNESVRSNNCQDSSNSSCSSSTSSADQDEEMILDDRMMSPCQEKGKHKCLYDEFDEDYDDDDDEIYEKNCSGKCRNSKKPPGDIALLHREKQLMKYRKRMIKRDKKKKESNGSAQYAIKNNKNNNCQNGHTCTMSNLDTPRSFSNGQSMQQSILSSQAVSETNSKNSCSINDPTSFSNGQSLPLSESMPQKETNYYTTSNYLPPLYHPTTKSIPESVQTQPIEMISIGTQTGLDEFPTGQPPLVYPNCNNCGNKMSLICWNCNDNMKSHDRENFHDGRIFPDNQPIAKSDLLLQAIQRTPKIKTQKNLLRSFKNNNNNQGSPQNNDCQLCKRQKTQHNFKPTIKETSPTINDSSTSISHCCSLKLVETTTSSTNSPMKCSCNKLLLVKFDDSTSKFFNNNSNFHQNLNDMDQIDSNSNQYRTPPNQESKSSLNEPPKKPTTLLSCDPKKKLLPKINLTSIFCGGPPISSPIPIRNVSNSANEAKQLLENFVFEHGTAMNIDDKLEIPPPEIPVQKSNSAPTLPPQSPSTLSPRFLKQAASFYKKRSRHLSDRSDRSDDQQYSDEDFDSLLYSPAASPIKGKFFQRGFNLFGRRALLGNLEESLLHKRLTPKTQVAGFKVLLGASGGFCPTQLTIPAAAYFYELEGQTLSTPYVCEIRLSRKGYTIPRIGTVQATLLNPIGTVVRMFVIPYNFHDMPPMNQTFIRQRILAVDSESESNKNSQLSQQYGADQLRSLRYSIHLRFQTSRSGRLTLHTDIRLLISRRTDCDTAAAHAKGALESPNELKIITTIPDCPKYSARQDTPTTTANSTHKI